MRISQNELERQRFLERQRAERDAAILAADVRFAQEELRVAQENARVAQEKGIRIGRIQLLQQLLTQPKTSIEELDKLLEADLTQLEETLKRQLSGPKQANGTSPADKV